MQFGSTSDLAGSRGSECPLRQVDSKESESVRTLTATVVYVYALSSRSRSEVSWNMNPDRRDWQAPTSVQQEQAYY